MYNLTEDVILRLSVFKHIQASTVGYEEVVKRIPSIRVDNVCGIKMENKRMGKITVTECGIDGLLVIEPTIFKDNRGYFIETYHKEAYEAVGITAEFVQDNQSMSTKGVLRGLHFQINYPQAKLVRVLSGEVFDVAVDLRKGSKTFGKWYGVVLSEENQKQFFVPEGFAHGYLVLSETAVFAYKCTDFYHPGDEGGLLWNDPEVGVEWPIPKDMELVIAQRDQEWGTLAEIK